MAETEQDSTGSSVDDANEDRLPASEDQLINLVEGGIGSKVEAPNVIIPKRFEKLAESADSRNSEDDGLGDDIEVEVGGREPIRRRSSLRDPGETSRGRQNEGRQNAGRRFGTTSSGSRGGYGSGFGSVEKSTHVAPSGTTPGKEGQMTTQNQENEFGDMLDGDGRRSDPIFVAVGAARAITTRFYREEQPAEYQELRAAVDAIPDDDRARAVFKLVLPVWREEVVVQSIFALARECRRMKIAHATGAIAKMMRAEGFTTEDLIEYGLAERRFNEENTRSWLNPFIGRDAIRKASVKMEDEGKSVGARILRTHLSVSEEARANAIALRKRREAGDGDNAVAASETTTTVAVGETDAGDTEGGGESPESANGDDKATNQETPVASGTEGDSESPEGANGEAPNEGEKAPVGAATEGASS